MQDINWVDALASLNWTTIIVSLIGGTGLLGILIQDRTMRRRKNRNREADDRAAETVSTPATGDAVHDVEAFRMAQQAMKLADDAREQNRLMETRLAEVEKELSIFRRSYHVLYWWVQALIYDWDTYRDEPAPPDLPADIHHPNA